MKPQLDAARTGAFFVVLAILYAIETLWPKRPWETPRWKRLTFHLALSTFNSVLLRWTIAAPLFVWTDYVQRQGWGVAGWLGLRGPWEILLTLIVMDNLDYWWHLMNHRVPFLWRLHRTHHLDTHVDVTTALRFHPGELLLSSCVKMLWVIFWGPSVLGFAIFETGITMAALFHHSNIDFSDAWEKILRPIVMTPRVHASHHTVALRSRDANYATIFSIWDRLFSSFEEPSPDELRSLGLSEGRATYLSIRALLLSPFVL